MEFLYLKKMEWRIEDLHLYSLSSKSHESFIQNMTITPVQAKNKVSKHFLFFLSLFFFFSPDKLRKSHRPKLELCNLLLGLIGGTKEFFCLEA